MKNSLEILTNNLNLSQSELFKKDYENTEIRQVHTFNDLSISDLSDWYNSILNKYTFLEGVQLENFQLFLNSLKNVLSIMNPERLNIKVDSNDEELDLLLWRESNQGISKLCFDTFGQITYTFNGFNGNKKRGVFDSNVEMEKLLYLFLGL